MLKDCSLAFMLSRSDSQLIKLFGALSSKIQLICRRMKTLDSRFWQSELEYNVGVCCAEDIGNV